VLLFDRFRQWWRGHPTVETEPAAAPEPGRARGSVDHVIILDGTLSTLEAGQEGNCGLIYQMLTEFGRTSHRTVYYEPGIQWEGWRQAMNVVQGKGINRQIRRAYGWLASHYREGDRIFLFGYSRGAYARNAGSRLPIGTIKTIRTLAQVGPLGKDFAMQKRRLKWWGCLTRLRLWACDCRCFGCGQTRSMIFITTIWGDRFAMDFKPLRFMKPVRCLSLCCGTARRDGRAMCSKSGFAVRMAILVA
jgi:Uncharacterized alpha/beta hydrolase domain (DUF2235)